MKNLLISRQLCFIFWHRNIFDRCLSQLIFAGASFLNFRQIIFVAFSTAGMFIFVMRM